ncbi:MAG: HPr family phosphocarrier protein [candidate division Zixibacteria bacterium]|nr:HPr family phosphocarrier protein [candidate division Zixibacteria bacterium]
MICENTVTILNKTGLHMRPAEKIVHLATRFKSEIVLSRDGLDVNGKSLMGVLMLAAECGSSITIQAEGDDASAAVSAIVALVANRFGESE